MVITWNTEQKIQRVLFASLIVTCLLLMLLEAQNIYAEHDLDEDYPFVRNAGGATQSICLDLNEMNDVDINGSTGNALIIYNAAANAIDMFNDETNMDLSHTYASNCSSNANKAGARNYGSNVQGVEWIIIQIQVLIMSS